MKNIEDQVTRDNVSKLMRGEFDFNPEKILNKTLTFGTNKIDERNNDGLMIDALNDKTIDEFYIEYPCWFKLFYSETRRWKIRN